VTENALSRAHPPHYKKVRLLLAPIVCAMKGCSLPSALSCTRRHLSNRSKASLSCPLRTMFTPFSWNALLTMTRLHRSALSHTGSKPRPGNRAAFFCGDWEHTWLGRDHATAELFALPARRFALNSRMKRAECLWQLCLWVGGPWERCAFWGVGGAAGG